MIIGFSGKRGSGKDTYSHKLKVFMGNVKFLAFGDAVKNELTYIYDLIRFAQDENDAILSVSRFSKIGYDEVAVLVNSVFDSVRGDDEINGFTKNEHTMFAMQYWATDVRRKYDEDYWVNIVRQSILEYSSVDYHVFITDVRFPNEADAVIESGGVLVRLDVSAESQLERIMKRDNVVLSESFLNHDSEVSLDSYENFSVRIDTDRVDALDILIDYVESYVR